MNWQDSPWHKAAALAGVASNEAYPLTDRLTAAIQALDLIFDADDVSQPAFSDVDVAVENGVPHGEAVAALELFIAEAQAALEALKAKCEMGVEQP